MTAYLARYGTPAFLGTFREEAGFAHGDAVVVTTPRGLEVATVLCECESPATPSLAFVRNATSEDLVEPKVDWNDVEWPGLLVDSETLLDGTLILHLVPDEATDYTPLVEALCASLGRPVKLYDLRGPTEKSGCGKDGCGSGGCSDSGGGCGTGNCSRGAKKQDVAAALTALRVPLG